MTPDKARKYMEIAYATARLSKDTSTKVGALIVGPSQEVRALGYNGAPRGSSADELADVRNVRPEKYFWFSHAELNAITNAARVGTPLEGSTLLVTHPPCIRGCSARGRICRSRDRALHTLRRVWQSAWRAHASARGTLEWGGRR